MGKKNFAESDTAKNLVAMFGAEGDQGEDTQAEKKTKTEKEKKQKPAKKKPGAAAPAADIPRGYVMKKESKSQRSSILFRPSTLEDLKAAAEKRGISFNDLCNQILENFLEEERARK